MRWFNNLKILTNLIGGFLIVLIILAAVGFFGITSIEKVSQQSDKMYGKMLVPLNEMGEISTKFQRVRVNTRDIILATTPEEIKKNEDLINQYRKEIGALADQYEKEIVSDEMRQMFNEFKEARVEYGDHLTALIGLAKANKDIEAFAYLNGDMRTSANKEMELIDKMEAKKVIDADNLAISNESISRNTYIMMLVAIFGGIFLGILISILTALSITRPLKKITNEVKSLAENGGDLTQVIPIDTKNEIGDLARATNKFLSNLRNIMIQVMEGSKLVAISSQQLTISSEQTALATNQVAGVVSSVSQGAEEQVSSVDEASAAVEQISAAIQESASNADSVAALADATASATEKGLKAVGNTIVQMNNIRQATGQTQEAITKLAESSNQITDIVNIISGIAAQTNLLALNAAIEAARAGEQGRGFAVVAEEVRKLSEQSQVAAKQITDLIALNHTNINNAVSSMNNGVANVRNGIEVVNTANDAFEDITNLVSKVTVQIQEVSIGIQQMAESSRNIVVSMEGISQVSKETSVQMETVSASTQEQSAAIEEIAASSQSMAQIAEELKNTVGKFKV
ncbi:methyl-accepting chemotaxis protein [Desulfosporosinus sp. HMP52]|uniref:methyl-accepting chemotaxis protein n=1 Tax=Desulfosporosinus sp. HMP52 TaxID=1487923 RepID=UPI00068ECDE4|nr:methyl-accepting chemotaxis protein [Desulfosporosinus sp. HMP52]